MATADAPSAQPTEGTDPISAPDGSHEAGDEATNVFSKSILISGVRCLLAYVIFPFVTPLIGLASGFEGAIGLIIGAVAIAANLFSIRRFWSTDHRWKIPITVLNVAVIILLVILAVQDIATLTG